MSDDTANAGDANRIRINVHEACEMRHWSNKLGVTLEDLKEAVYSVGSMAHDVRRYLQN